MIGKILARLATDAVIGHTVDFALVIRAFDQRRTGALIRRFVITEQGAVVNGNFAIISISDFAADNAISPCAGLVSAFHAVRTFFIGALGLAAFALVTLGNAERNAGLGIWRTSVLTVPVTLAGIVTVGGGNVLFAVAAVAGRHRRLARSLDFFFGGKSRAGVAAMPELV